MAMFSPQKLDTPASQLGSSAQLLPASSLLCSSTPAQLHALQGVFCKDKSHLEGRKTDDIQEMQRKQGQDAAVDNSLQ